VHINVQVNQYSHDKLQKKLQQAHGNIATLEKLHEVIDSQNQTIMGQDAGRLTPFSIPAALGSQTAP
jgi:hypothetical protein